MAVYIPGLALSCQRLPAPVPPMLGASKGRLQEAPSTALAAEAGGSAALAAAPGLLRAQSSSSGLHLQAAHPCVRAVASRQHMLTLLRPPSSTWGTA